jgi:hypothetical protein
LGYSFNKRIFSVEVQMFRAASAALKPLLKS